MDKTKPFGLVLPKRAPVFRPKSNAAFNSDSEEEPSKRKTCTKIPQAKPISKKVVKTEQCDDPSIYEYDSIYDDMKAQEVAKIAPKEDKPSRYIDSLLKAAEKRKKNFERRLEKKVQVEREHEGDKFKDKEAFVTSAYKKKMLEMEEEEEKERRENQLNDMMDVTKQKDLSGFYRHFLKQSVGEEKVPVFGERMDIKKEPQDEPDSDQPSVSIENITPKDSTLEPNLDRDSDIDLSSDVEASDSKDCLPNEEKGNIKSVRNSHKGPKCSDNDDMNDNGDLEETKTEKRKFYKQKRKRSDDNSNDDVESKVEGKKSRRQIRKRTDDVDDDHINNYNSEDIEIDKTQLSKQISKKNEDADSDSSSGSESSDETSPNSESSKVNDNSVDHQKKTSKEAKAELERTQSRKNIFEKRTVGAVFAEAQARYFQRMAARTAA